MTRAARWVALLAGLAVALVYLSSAAYSMWAGDGAPTNLREAWTHRAFAHLCYSAAALFGGAALFRVVRRPLRLDGAAMAFVAMAIVFVAAPNVRRHVLVDRCLDAGGRWDAAAFRCQR